MSVMTPVEAVKPRGPGRPCKGARRGDLALLEAAQGTFAQYGFEGASVRQIAAAAGVDAALTAHHFGSKEALWQAVVERLAESRGQWVDEVKSLAANHDVPVAERLEQALRRLVAVIAAEPDLGMFVARIAAERGERLEFLKRKMLRPSFDAFLPLLKEAMAAGVIAEQPVEVMYFMLLNAISMTISYREIVESFGGRFGEAESIGDAVTECLMVTLLPGLRKRDAAKTDAPVA